jgi:hypothetical protein
MEPFWRHCNVAITYGIWDVQFFCKNWNTLHVALSISNSKLRW